MEGAIWIPDHLEPEKLRNNFADLAFFKQLMSALKEHGCLICVATYADTEDGALASGGSLVRAYLDAALDGASKDFIPGKPRVCAVFVSSSSCSFSFFSKVCVLVRTLTSSEHFCGSVF
jgi:hypothetical protein